MRAAVTREPNVMEMADVPDAPDPGPGQARVRFTACTAIEIGSTNATMPGSSMSPTGNSCWTGSVSRSASAPSMWTPMRQKSGQVLERPIEHA